MADMRYDFIQYTYFIILCIIYVHLIFICMYLLLDWQRIKFNSIWLQLFIVYIGLPMGSPLWLWSQGRSFSGVQRLCTLPPLESSIYFKFQMASSLFFSVCIVVISANFNFGIRGQFMSFRNPASSIILNLESGVCSWFGLNLFYQSINVHNTMNVSTIGKKGLALY